MSERAWKRAKEAEALLEAIAYAALGSGISEAVDREITMDTARAICEHLGVTWEDVAMLREMAQKFNVGADNHEVTGPLAVWADQKAEALATLLEAGGIER